MITVDGTIDTKITSPPEALEKILADPALLLVMDGQRHVFEVEGQGIAVQQQHHHRQEDHLDEAGQIPADVDQLFAKDRPGADEVHGLVFFSEGGSYIFMFQ